MSDVGYWRDRLQRFGHTGWSDAAVYAYDQRLRLAAIRGALDAMPDLEHDAALDYGCGVGDFCTMLAGRFTHVDGHDPVPEVLAAARARNGAPNVSYVDVLDPGGEPRYDLLLCVTVLQHITDDAELDALLKRLVASLRPRGAFVVLETFAGRSAAPQAATLKRRSATDLVSRFVAAGLWPVAEHGFYHPTEAPTPAFRRYREAWNVKLLGRLADRGWTLARRVLERRAAHAAATDDAFLDQLASPTRLIVFRREGL